MIALNNRSVLLSERKNRNSNCFTAAMMWNYSVPIDKPNREEAAMLERLEFMIALSREQHFGRAAESCGVAQPTLSLGIQSLEQMLNTPLVKRASRFQGFTPEGERVLMWAHRLVGDARAMRRDLLWIKNGTDTDLRIAALPSAMLIVARLTIPLQLRHPNVRFTVLGRTSTVLLKMLRQREIDAGV